MSEVQITKGEKVCVCVTGSFSKVQYIYLRFNVLKKTFCVLQERILEEYEKVMEEKIKALESRKVEIEKELASI